MWLLSCRNEMGRMEILSGATWAVITSPEKDTKHRPLSQLHPTVLYEHTVLMHMPFFVFLLGLHLFTFTLSHSLSSLALCSWISPWGPGWRTWSRRPGWFCPWCAWASPRWWYWSCPRAQRSATGLSWLLVSGEMLAKPSCENRFSHETDCVPEQTN